MTTDSLGAVVSAAGGLVAAVGVFYMWRTERRYIQRQNSAAVLHRAEDVAKEAFSVYVEVVYKDALIKPTWEELSELERRGWGHASLAVGHRLGNKIRAL